MRWFCSSPTYLYEEVVNRKLLEVVGETERAIKEELH